MDNLRYIVDTRLCVSFGSVHVLVTSIQTCILCLQDIAVVRVLADVMQEQFRIPGLCGLLV